MPQQFKCANPKCGYAIAAEGLSKVELEVLRRWAKTCPDCGKQTRWIEQSSLLKTQSKTKANGGLRNGKNTKVPRKTNR